ncbi:type IA DNA topoisomerase [Virgibacillus sp. MSP4-1]|uniref:type IA DNA topoisomerase n=1 Tax=Virgibacillus sp. MSP4-1 TaxID=2700081 RepID=UPI00039C9FE6|nr:type IA DNA topoisomerase [Virgibacillus sp. MSP4-1]QHS23676.1 type IA DNA topoisomerase [Virgibacillus sp. MSP4-1]
MQLILAEKPSVAKNIADALNVKGKKDGYYEGENFLITWAFGHLLELYDAKDYDSKMARWKMDNFPFIPSSFQYKVKSNPKDRSKPDWGVQKQLKTVHQLMKRSDVEAIISACDYDREGQLIGDSIIYKQKPKKQVYRLLLNEWTPEGVKEGMSRLRPNQELRPLLDAGMSRQWADWVIGINLTSVATLKYQKGKGKALNIGRVLLPTLKIIYDRDKEIEQFKPEEYFKLTAAFKTRDGETYEGTYMEKKQEKFNDQNVLTRIREAVMNKDGNVIDKQVERKKEFPPYLFNLSNLQGFITNKYKGWSSDKVLKVAQSLYEKKLITYPRTSSIALDESLVRKTAKVLNVHSENLPYKDEITFKKSKRVFNNQKVESHSAIIPTYMKPKQLTRDQEIVYTAIKNRFIMQFMPIAESEQTLLKTKVDAEDVNGYFLTKGKVQIVEGWKKVDHIQSKDVILPKVNLNDQVSVADAKVSSHMTKPPKRHTEKTLLKVMETCGKSYKEEEEAGDDSSDEEMLGSILAGFSIGTPATRAETIKKLKDIGYIKADKKNLICTPLGKRLVESFPIQELFDLEFTGRLEKTLSDIEKNKVKKDQFLNLVFSFTSDSVEKIKQAEDITINEIKSSKISNEVLGKCPVCGENVIDSYVAFSCSNWKKGKGCSFAIWKNDKYLASMKKKPTKTMVKSLLKNGRAHVKGLTSKKGKKFSAYLKYEKDPDKKYFSWKMEFK